MLNTVLHPKNIFKICFRRPPISQIRIYKKFQINRKLLKSVPNGLKCINLQIVFGTSGRRSSWSAFGRSTGKDVSGHFKRHYFLFFLFFSPLSTFLKEGVLGSNNLFSESCLECPKTSGYTPFQTPSATNPRMVTQQKRRSAWINKLI